MHNNRVGQVSSFVCRYSSSQRHLESQHHSQSFLEDVMVQRLEVIVNCLASFYARNNPNLAHCKCLAGANETQSVRTLTGSFKLFLEWLTISALIIAMQLPQAVLVYWSASSSFVLAQVNKTSSLTEALTCSCPKKPFS